MCAKLETDDFERPFSLLFCASIPAAKICIIAFLSFYPNTDRQTGRITGSLMTALSFEKE